MIIPDLNLLLYVADSESPFHAKAAQWWEAELNAGGDVGLPWHVILGFMRIVTSIRAFQRPMTVEEAFAEVQNWLIQPGVSPINPGPGHARRVRDLLVPMGVGGKLVADAHLAAIAIEHHATLATNDRDFQRFVGLRFHNPLAP